MYFYEIMYSHICVVIVMINFFIFDIFQRLLSNIYSYYLCVLNVSRLFSKLG